MISWGDVLPASRWRFVGATLGAEPTERTLEGSTRTKQAMSIAVADAAHAAARSRGRTGLIAVLVMALDRSLELPHPGSLLVALLPRAHRIGEQVELYTALVLAGPDVRQRPTQLGVPQERREIVDRHHHAHVVHGRVGGRADYAVGERAAAEQPDVSRGCRGDRVFVRDRRVVHPP